MKRSEIVLDRGDGSYVWDLDGRRLLDMVASLWYCHVGHGREEIAQSVANQMTRLETFSTFQRYANQPALDLASRLANLAPLSDAKVIFASGGSDAVETAVRLVRRYWTALGRPEKRIIISRQGSYHGLHGFGASLTGLPANRVGYGPFPADVVQVPAQDAAAVELVLERDGPDAVAAFFFEPVIGSGGVIFPDGDYLHEVQAICRDHDVLFVADEVITAFGRIGAMFAAERFGLEVDILLFAKGVTSGYLPLGGLLVDGRIAEPFWRDDSDLIFRHGVTYAGHASVCAAALANLDILEHERLAERAHELEVVLAATLGELADHPLVKEVRTGPGLLAGVQLVDEAVANMVADRCLLLGLLPRVAANGTLEVSPPLVIKATEIQVIGSTLRQALDDVAELQAHTPSDLRRI